MGDRDGERWDVILKTKKTSSNKTNTAFLSHLQVEGAAPGGGGAVAAKSLLRGKHCGNMTGTP